MICGWNKSLTDVYVLDILTISWQSGHLCHRIPFLESHVYQKLAPHLFIFNTKCHGKRLKSSGWYLNRPKVPKDGTLNSRQENTKYKT